MNVYRCWHGGIKGYGCRVRKQNWMFVPEMHQPDNRVHKSLRLMDLTFINRFEKDYEIRNEEAMRGNAFYRFIRDRLHHRQPLTVYGKLLLS